MRIFVASWFFPPSTSSEGIVTFKLLKKSQHQYDVCSAKSDAWSYKHALPVTSDNINVFAVETDDIDVWVERAAEIFFEKHQERPYDAIMTRSMPPESILVAKKIRERYPDIPWLASLADPMARSPYHLKLLVDENEMLKEHEKADFKVALKYGCDSWENHRCKEIRYLCELKKIEDYAINDATTLIFPCEALKSYMLEGKVKNNAVVIPHSFDKTLYQEPTTPEKDAVKTISFLGHTDNLRSLEPIVRALWFLKQNRPEALSNVRFRFVGNITEDVRSLVYNYFLYDVVSVEGSVDYATSLRIMRESDWLLHVDAYFESCESTGGSIFFAGKLADYMGTSAPILSLTGRRSPADYLTRNAGGIAVDPTDIPAIADAITDIAFGNSICANLSFRERFSNSNVAKLLDERLDALVKASTEPTREEWPDAPCDTFEEKLISICIPAYNVEPYLDRCLQSLLLCKTANALDIIVVNDGSKDQTSAIAHSYEEHFPEIIRVIDKENGGHGSTINAALKVARGVYFRVIDGDDWVDSINFDKQIRSIFKLDTFPDIISGNYDQVYLESGEMVAWTKHGNFKDYEVFDFATSDFSQEYFTMASVLFKTTMMRNAHFELQEHTFYVDVEYLLFPIPYAQTVMFTPEHVYRYAVGNTNQSINPSVFTNRYDHHDRVIRRMVTYYVERSEGMGEGQREYMRSLLLRHLLPSHYTLSLVWDPDRKRGCERAHDFDSFLEHTSKDLYDECGKRLRSVRHARKAHYNPSVFAQPGDVGMRKEDRLENAKTTLVETLYQSDIGHKIAKNKLAYKVYERYFQQK
ncbi:glycosyltransferase [Adlercreutzia sp. ZJ242]|uniref:glycosyltransferase n=1 Tax=Adlercreutzia sp. ZJ242 TaxID=2709409 RepID=UPI0013ED9549|nr:glycosyltransferase [Adlercreutzia sp. ZJ242]